MNRLAIAIVSLLTVIGISVVWSYLARPEKQGVDIYPERLQVRIVLPDHEIGELSREVNVADDESVKMVTVNYPDGSYGHAYYRGDGTVAQVIKYHPEVEGVAPVVMTEALYAEDGLHLVLEKHYLKDGTLSRSGSRLPSGDYLVKNFAADGVKIAGEIVFTEDGAEYDLFERHPNGNFKRLAKTISGGKEETTFHENGLKATYHKAAYSHKIWERYQNDGTTPIVKFELKGEGDHHGVTYKMYASYFNADGSVNHKREFTAYWMSVIFVDDQGNITHQQRYRPKAGSSVQVTSLGPDQWTLMAVYMGEDSIGSNSFWFTADGKIEKQMNRVELNGGEYRIATRKYHPDGSLMSFRRPDPANLAKDWLEDNYKPGESPERFDYSLLTGLLDRIPYEEPPEIPPVDVYDH